MPISLLTQMSIAMKIILIALIGLILTGCETSKKSAQKEKYIFFLHNRFIQLFDLNVVHPEYGRAEYNEILNQFRDSGFTVLSEKRPHDTRTEEYANKIKNQIDSLLNSGVSPDHITIVGTSMGGYIAQYASTYLKNPDLNFVLIGCYMENDIQTMPEIQLCGNILSIYEKSDTLGVSMQKRIEASQNKIPNFKEIELDTRLQHGFLYHPMEEWMKPTMQWAHGDYH